jgi:glycosyltransferase involved in cell wall biosynthesis
VRCTPLVTVVIPCFNQADFIDECINSVLNQSYKNIEIICVDDCSTDNSVERINKYTDLKNFRLIKNSHNLGVCASRNMAVNEANGLYILPLDGDDTIEPAYIEEAVHVISSNEDIGIVYCKARFFGEINQNWDLPDFNVDDFLFNNCIFCTALFRKSDFLRAGGYKPYMTDGYEDYELWICFVELGLKPYRIDKILFNYRRKHQISRTDRLMDSGRFKNMKREILAHHFNFYLNNECFIRYLTESCPKRLENLINENEQLKQSNVELKKYWESVYNNLQRSFEEQISKNQKKAKKVRKYKRLLVISYLIFCCILASMFYLTKQ